jgi:hypothetical protein
LAFLAAAACFFEKTFCKKNESTLAFNKEVIRQTATIVATTQFEKKPAESKPFNWKQLESADYRTYIRNLRHIGCPEPTLRAIVTADVNAIYQARSQKLEHQLADLINSPWPAQLDSYKDEQILRNELQKLPAQEDSEIASLLGLKPVALQTLASNSRDLNHTAPTLPLVFQKVDLNMMNLDEQQIQAINDLRQNFIEEIGGLHQDPNDPTYLARWEKAQPEVDDDLRGMLGVSVWENYQLASQGNDSALAARKP